MMTPVKCVNTGPISELTNTYTSQNTKHKKGFNVNILHTQETNCEFYKETLKYNFSYEKDIVLCSKLSLMIISHCHPTFLSFQS